MKNYITFLLIFLGLMPCGCEKEVELNLKTTTPKLCLNCIMEAGNDSLVVYISKTKPVDDPNTEIVFIPTAEINLFKDGVFLSDIPYSGKNKYTLKHKPISGSSYRIEAKVEGFEPLFAETTVPEKPDVMTWFKRDTIPDDRWEKGYYIEYLLKVELKDIAGKDNYWFIRATMRIVAGIPYGSYGTAYRTDNLFFDDFNRYYSQDYWAPFTNFEYYGALRLSDENFENGKVTFVIPAGDYPTLFSINADEHFDKYYKSSIKQFLTYEYEGLPVFEPIQIYSNVENGFGIFGSIAVAKFYFNEKIQQK